MGEDEEEVDPAAYLNYILFDKDLNYLQGGFVNTVDGNQGSMKQFSINDIEVTQPGHLFVYVSSESSNTNKQIWFDELEISTTQPIIQVDEYYPFGLSISELSTTRENIVEQQFKYNGKELQSDFDLGWYDYSQRMQDPSLGRFFTTDRFDEKYYPMSPYQYGANNPIKYIDINGDSLMLFKNGEYVTTVDDGKTEITGFNQESEVDEDGNEVFTGGQSFDFNDQDVDPQAIRNGVITKVEFVSDKKVERQLERSGVLNNVGYSYAKRESKAARKMDYGFKGALSGDLKKNTFYVRDGTAYNIADFGNYLWGMGMAELRIPRSIAQMGAHYNNFVNGRMRRTDQTSLYDFGPGTYGSPGILDSPADQRAIVAGYKSRAKKQLEDAGF